MISTNRLPLRGKKKKYPITFAQVLITIITMLNNILNKGVIMEWNDRISIDPKVLVGKPVLKSS